ncbi:Hemerythrin-like domain-containing protein [Streptosporangium subroseum]|uniref:Hemerythrin-like domain-containing protein n=1 Tax=Streptosporangium subroseum TaxID=106412 RepID=A0A239AH71_9ACTN|nr:hemerythrin domain-containing protein [Streptosporangium subroseum]SNR94987.1 Hemerythrin-like domain-containing protein [Streptosporangium subroseum]
MTTADEQYADIREMYMVHTVFRREFALLPALVRGVTVGDKERSQLIADHIGLLNSSLHHHHHGEDKHLWPRLLERGSTEIAPIVHVMEEQHEGIEKAHNEINAALEAWRGSAASEPRKALADTIDRLIPLLNEHMGMEEERVLPIIAKTITAAEWGQMVQEGGADTPPEHLPLLFGMMMYEGDPDVIEIAVSSMPAEARPVIKDLASQAFASYSELIHGTATPPRSRD